jgi:hypothetical protein
VVFVTTPQFEDVKQKASAPNFSGFAPFCKILRNALAMHSKSLVFYLLDAETHLQAESPFVALAFE